jgi:hypothetical protein
MRIFGPLSEENGSIYRGGSGSLLSLLSIFDLQIINLHAPRAGKSKQQENFDNSEPILRNLIKQHPVAHLFGLRRDGNISKAAKSKRSGVCWHEEAMASEMSRQGSDIFVDATCGRISHKPHCIHASPNPSIYTYSYRIIAPFQQKIRDNGTTQ